MKNPFKKEPKISRFAKRQRAVENINGQEVYMPEHIKNLAARMFNTFGWVYPNRNKRWYYDTIYKTYMKRGVKAAFRKGSWISFVGMMRTHKTFFGMVGFVFHFFWLVLLVWWNKKFIPRWKTRFTSLKIWYRKINKQ